MKKVLLIGVLKNDKPYISERYLNAIKKWGGTPVLEDINNIKNQIIDTDALLVCGGGDLDPAFYGEERKYNLSIDKKVDWLEYLSVKSFFAMKKPILGICRGMQSVNVFLGGSLYQNIKNDKNICHDKEYHFANAVSGSIFYNLFEKRFAVNSYHSQSIKKMSPFLVPTLYSDDKIIEGFESPNKKIIGCQFHPERMPYFDGLFKYFLNI